MDIFIDSKTNSTPEPGSKGRIKKRNPMFESKWQKIIRFVLLVLLFVNTGDFLYFL